MSSATQDLVMAIFPNTRGVAYAVFEGLVPIDWGISDAHGRKRNEVCLRRVSMLLDRYNPDVLLLRDHSDVSTKRASRVHALILAIGDLAATRRSMVTLIARQQVREAFGGLEDPTRHAIVHAISQRLPFLEPLAPPARKIWNSEDRRMGLFNAMALVLTFLDQGARHSVTET